MTDADIRKEVRERYGDIAKQSGGCCGDEEQTSCCGGGQSVSSCCGSSSDRSARQISETLGYSAADIRTVPEGANLGLGCGNPTALASIQPGESVLDLGSGAGFDCFLASKRVGKDGTVIGVDMTPDMLEAARKNAAKGDYKNVEFRLGEIENLPVADATVDLVISNCVINLSVNKRRVFKEAFRVLRPGGRLMISDIVLNHPLPEKIRESSQAYCQCISGAALKEEYLGMIGEAGFESVEIVTESAYSASFIARSPEYGSAAGKMALTGEEAASAGAALVSAAVSARKPG